MRTKELLVIVVLLIATASIAYAAPNTPSQFTKATPERRIVDSSAKTVSAQAGNITRLEIYHIMITKRWQGYYGNVSGIITLDDASNYTLYDWSLGTVEGEIYAANASVSSWTTIHCVNFTSNGTNCPWSNSETNGISPTCLNLSKLEQSYGADPNDNDGVDETFNKTLSNVMVGSVTLNNCPMVNLYQNDSSVSNVWNETMLTLNNTETVIYTSVINDDTWGFNNQTWDFQMIVGENGDDSAVTTYYFYVELT